MKPAPPATADRARPARSRGRRERAGVRRVLHVRHEVEEQEVDVLDLVVALAHRLLRPSCPLGMWPLTRMPVLVCVLGDDGHQLRIERAVDLDLHVAELGVVVDRSARLLPRSTTSTLVGPAKGPGPSMKPASSTRGPTASPESHSCFRSRSVSMSLAESRTVVTPAARLSRPSSSPRWACMSHRPGMHDAAARRRCARTTGRRGR